MISGEMAEEKDAKEVVKGKKSIFSRFWNGLIRLHGDDFEKRLQYIHKEEATILARMKTRSTRWRKTARNIIVSSILLEVVAIGYAILTTRSGKLDPKMRALRVLPIFVLPALSWALYAGLKSLTGMCDRRDQRTLERLRAERQTKIDELKERTNYYNTQQLIQRYDTDPAAKAAAASVLASKLGADSGLHVFVDESHLSQHGIGKSSDVEFAQSSGLRRRNQADVRSPGSNVMQNFDKESTQYAGSEVSDISLPSELDHQSHMAITPQDGGWIARIAAMLVGEDPTQSYALICGNCHMHNGLARKEDSLVITYYCPHCHALNRPRNFDENSTPTNSPNMRSLITHHHALNKHESPSDTNTPDLKPIATHLHSEIKPSKTGEVNSDANTANKRSLHHAMDKSNENSSDDNTPDMKSSTKAVTNPNLIKQSNESMSENVSTSSAPVALAADETKKIVVADPASH